MLTKSNYLDLIGIQQWQLRTQSAPAVLIPHHMPSGAQWLFIQEKQEVMQESALLQAIFTAIKQSASSVAIAYYDTPTSATKTVDLTNMRYIVVMGNAAEDFKTSPNNFSENTSVIISANLQILAQDITAKRALWQQLKQHQT